MKLRNNKKYSYKSRTRLGKFREKREKRNLSAIRTPEHHLKDLIQEENCHIFTPKSYPTISTPKHHGCDRRTCLEKRDSTENIMRELFFGKSPLKSNESNHTTDDTIDISKHQENNNYEISVFGKSALNETDKFDDLERDYLRNQHKKRQPKWTKKMIRVTFKESTSVKSTLCKSINAQLKQNEEGLQNYLTLLKKFELHKNMKNNFLT
ncbi:hypothetical protein SNEBB_002510 [Seison nebaliae]|nr:hypothetical protein SNEBB_002510 [Seison nebaliae]